jgi:hypothetical protein
MCKAPAVVQIVKYTSVDIKLLYELFLLFIVYFLAKFY